MDTSTFTSTYHQRLQARRAELDAITGRPPDAGPTRDPTTDRRQLARAARARSARRWLDNGDRPDQEARATRLRLVPD